MISLRLMEHLSSGVPADTASGVLLFSVINPQHGYPQSVVTVRLVLALLPVLLHI